MKKASFIYHLRLALILAASTVGLSSLTSCSSEQDVTGPDGSALRPLSFSADVGKHTRGTVVETVEESFGVFSYVYDGEWNTDNNSPGENFAYINNDEVVYLGGLNYATSGSYTQPTADRKIRFYAYYPYQEITRAGASEGITDITEGSIGSAPTIEYSVPAEVEKQLELMQAVREEQNTTEYNANEGAQGGIISLTFDHLLTQVNFVTGNISEGVIKSITIKNVKYKGTYTLGSDHWDSVSDDLTSYTINPKFVTDGTAGKLINEAPNTLLLMPQTFTWSQELEDANKVPTIEIVFDDGIEHVLSAPIVYYNSADDSRSTSEWGQNKIVTYTVSINSVKNLMTVTATIQDWNDGGETEAGVSDSNIIRPGASVSEWDQQETTEDTKPINE